MGDFIFRALAVVGALVILVWLVGETAAYMTRNAATGVVHDEAQNPIPGVPVFLNRGYVIERYVTDSAGRFFLPIAEHEMDDVLFLICAPGRLPMIARRNSRILGSSGYTPGKISIPDFPHSYRGWAGPIPRECPQRRSPIGWRYPASAGKDPNAMSVEEPVWDR